MNAVASLDRSILSRRRFVRSLAIGTLLINLFVVVMVALVIEQRREREEIQAITLTENYAKVLDEALVGFIGKIDITLLSVRDEVTRQMANGGIDDKALAAFLTQQDAHIPEALGLRVVDADGIIRHGAQGVRVANASIADRPQFIRLRDDPAAGLVFSKPLMGRAAQQQMITLGRRIDNPDGSFAGDVHVAVTIDQFINLFAKIDLGPKGNIGLWDHTNLIARYARDDARGASAGATTPSAELHALLESPPQTATYHTRSGVDGISRAYHFRRINSYPLYLVVGLADDDYLAEARNDARNLIGLAVIFIVTSLFSALLLYRGWQRREADHAALLRQETDYTGQLEQAKRLAEEAQRQSELILASAGEGICGVDLAGKVVFVNPAGRKMLGWAADEGVGLDLHATTHHHKPDGSPYAPADCDVSRTLHDGARRQVNDDLYWRKDGSCFPVEFTVAAVELDGRVSGAVNVFRDISERKRSEAELQQHRRNLEELVQQRTTALMETEARASHILDSSADGLYGSDRNGIITFINPAACAMLGYRAEQVIGRPVHPLFHHSRADGSPYPAAECPGLRALKLGQQVRVDNEVYWHADGHAIPVMYATHPMLRNGEIIGAVTSFVDVSEQRAAAQARERALLAAESLARIRREFLANMSHEIRTPLNGVLGFADIGYRHYDNSDKARDAFAKIRTSGKRLLGVINDILDFSKLDAGKLNIEQIDLVPAEIVSHALDLVRDQAQAKQLELRVRLAADLPGLCIGDPLRIGQVLLNVLSNAVKFTPSGSVTLSLSRQDEQLVFRVTDTGIGMSGEQLAMLFNPFQQADASSTRRYGGTGLGLAISKQILDLMGGEIRVISEPGVGTTVEFRLPYIPSGRLAVPPADQSDAAPPAGAGSLAGLSILVVDDDSANQAILEENLTLDGARVTLAGDGLAAVERVRQDGPAAYDIVLMDIQMPGIDGYEAARQILALAPGLPIIAQTAHAFAEEREKCRTAGMVGHIAKPIDQQELRQVLQRHRPAQNPPPV
ncbi:ATP-binding protein [Dechloromonas denitrificans]|uniref:ATP-binding protein n=1 Tax=Dechloromonas denitrificans TaxID=281362 RepID=UPI001CFA5A3E|nr:ATP-binding protein [Dechloromonas denitrificans]UCV07624.1 PAS domain S-box protein [Dechloromonas denitrificans]